MKKINFSWLWLGWIAAGFAIIAYTSLIWHSPWLQELACTDDSAGCFRDWVSALGGWAAVAAAIPTVRFLARQIKDANRHQRENLIIQLRRNRVMALHARNSATTLHRSAEVVKSVWCRPDFEDFIQRTPNANFNMHFYVLTQILDEEIFTFFEDEIAVTSPETVRSLRNLLTSHAELEGADAGEVDEANYKGLSLRMAGVCAHLQDWSTKCIAECTQYLIETENLIEGRHPANASST